MPPDVDEAIRDRVNSRQMIPSSNDVITEDSAAIEFVDRRGELLRFCHSTCAWFQWNGVFWQKDEIGATYQMVRELARGLSEDEDERTRKSAGKTGFASGVEKFAKVDPRVAVTVTFWDSDPWLIGTPGGIVDLRSGRLQPAWQEAGVSKIASVTPKAGGCPRWLAFLREATGDDEELIRFLQQFCGYCLTGSTREHALVFVYGPGGNGKSVFLNIVAAILKDYATTAAMDTFTASKGDKHSTDLAMLRGARLVTASETEEGRPWAEARIKQMTGSDPITARFMRQDNFTFTPTFKLIIVGNHKPVLKNVDEAARRRFNIVPFDRKPASPDRDLEQKLALEAPGILQWMIDGCLDWQANGLVRPASVMAATEAYFLEQDLIGQWIEDRCDTRIERGAGFIWDRSADLFESWSEYAHKAGEDPGSKKALSQALQKKGFEPYREPSTGARGFRFIRLKLEGSRTRDE